MSYKYDSVNGYRNADQIGADEEELNQEMLEIIKPIKKLDTSNVRIAINIISCKEKRQEIGKEIDVQKSESDISVTRNPNLVSEIQEDISKEEKELEA